MKWYLRFLNICGCILIGLAVMKAGQIRLMNSHLTETQLLMSEWDAWLAVVAIFVAGVVATNLKG